MPGAKRGCRVPALTPATIEVVPAAMHCHLTADPGGVKAAVAFGKPLLTPVYGLSTSEPPPARSVVVMVITPDVGAIAILAVLLVGGGDTKFAAYPVGEARPAFSISVTKIFA